MQTLRQALTGILMALISTALVLGSLLVSLAESGQPIGLAPSPTQGPELTATPQPTALPGMPTPTRVPTRTPTITLVPTANFTCKTPRDWVLYTIQGEDTLDSLAQRFHTTVEDLMKFNCLDSTTLVSGTVMYRPPDPPTPTGTSTATVTATSTPVPPTAKPNNTPTTCGRPAGWVTYIVQPGDTLFGLHLIFNVSIADLQRANCLGNSINIRSGSTLFVPFAFPSKTFTPARVPPTRTLTQVPPTRTLTPTQILPGTSTFTPTLTEVIPPTQTPTPTHTLTVQPTDTETPVPTDTPTQAPTLTFTPMPTATPTPTDTSTPKPNPPAP